ncbi:hypothetical protein SLEP1_g40574 [Rubroshorea leprosula]|uniref:Uncharacterized protein n=1 Tax=Rubroshorea leprosula TaxID=152421 RepID=A0AAV5L4E5_9ROSI|nr:hypothetical protein SLEP1_g40574 [Rubroshorea leprosula]
MAFWQFKEYSSIIQVVLILLGTVAGTIILAIGITMTIKYAPQTQQQPLLLKILSFSASNLNVSDSLTASSWETTLLFANRDTVLEIFMESFETLLYYNHSHPISCAVVKPIHLGPWRQRVVQAEFNGTQCGEEQPFVDEKVFEELRRDEEEGKVRFRMGMTLKVLYRTGILSWDYELKPKCPDLEVKLVGATGSGEVARGRRPWICSVPLLK